jgi:hypothetical protein
MAAAGRKAKVSSSMQRVKLQNSHFSSPENTGVQYTYTATRIHTASQIFALAYRENSMTGN